MPEKVITPAIIVSTTLYQERDLILGLLTRNEGLVSVMARSARASRRRFPGVLDLFVVFEAEFSLNRGSLPVLSAAEPLMYFPGILESLDRLEAGQMIIQIVRELLRDAPAPADVFDMVVQSFRYLDESIPEFAYLILLELVLWMAGDLGHVPVNGRCPGCGGMAREAGLAYDGRVLCRDCCVGPGYRLQAVASYPESYCTRAFLAVNPALSPAGGSTDCPVPDREQAMELISAVVVGITGGTNIFTGYGSRNCNSQGKCQCQNNN